MSDWLGLVSSRLAQSRAADSKQREGTGDAVETSTLKPCSQHAT
jgi:hypothetical protein